MPGNHEYEVDSTAAGYFGYFGSLAGTPDKGYYAYTLGAWRIYAINSEISHSASSTQGKWLQSDLAAHALTKCVLAYWHEPLFAGMQMDSGTQPLWRML